MRRLLALVPAVLLVLSLAPPAHADPPLTMTAPCVGSDGSTTGATATVKEEDGPTTSPGGRAIFLLDKLSVDNTCNVEYALVVFKPAGPCPLPGFCRTFFVVAPGTTRTLNAHALTRLDVWHLRFPRWDLKVAGRFTDACAARGPFTNFLVQADGTVITRPCGPPPP